MIRDIHGKPRCPEDEGYKAYFLEGVAAKNPYQTGTVDWGDWNAGFDIAKEDDYDDE